MSHRQNHRSKNRIFKIEGQLLLFKETGYIFSSNFLERKMRSFNSFVILYNNLSLSIGPFCYFQNKLTMMFCFCVEGNHNSYPFLVYP